MHTSPTRVAILASSDKTQQLLSDLLEGAGLEVVAREFPSDDFLSLVESVSPDVLLVDFSEESDDEIDIIDTLLGYDKLPILFNDSSPASGGADTKWAKKLARKLSELIATHKPDLSSASLVQPKLELSLEAVPGPSLEATAEPIHEPITEIASPNEPPPAAEQTTETFDLDEDVTAHRSTAPIPENSPVTPVTPTVQKPEGAAVNFWVLGASLGGPQAVRQFLAAVKADLPVAFILAQHIGGNHISLLAEQLNRVTPFKVLTARSGYLLRHHEVVLAPAEESISITEDGYLSLGPAPTNAIYSPS